AGNAGEAALVGRHAGQARGVVVAGVGGGAARGDGVREGEAAVVLQRPQGQIGGNEAGAVQRAADDCGHHHVLARGGGTTVDLGCAVELVVHQLGGCAGHGAEGQDGVVKKQAGAGSAADLLGFYGQVVHRTAVGGHGSGAGAGSDGVV